MLTKRFAIGISMQKQVGFKVDVPQSGNQNHILAAKTDIHFKREGEKITSRNGRKGSTWTSGEPGERYDFRNSLAGAPEGIVFGQIASADECKVMRKHQKILPRRAISHRSMARVKWIRRRLPESSSSRSVSVVFRSGIRAFRLESRTKYYGRFATRYVKVAVVSDEETYCSCKWLHCKLCRYTSKDTWHLCRYQWKPQFPGVQALTLRSDHRTSYATRYVYHYWLFLLKSQGKKRWKRRDYESSAWNRPGEEIKPYVECGYHSSGRFFLSTIYCVGYEKLREPKVLHRLPEVELSDKTRQIITVADQWKLR